MGSRLVYAVLLAIATADGTKLLQLPFADFHLPADELRSLARMLEKCPLKVSRVDDFSASISTRQLPSMLDFYCRSFPRLIAAYEPHSQAPIIHILPVLQVQVPSEDCPYAKLHAESSTLIIECAAAGLAAGTAARAKRNVNSTAENPTNSTPTTFVNSTATKASSSASEKTANSTPTGYANSKPTGYANSTPTGYANSTPTGYANSTPTGYANSTSATPFWSTNFWRFKGIALIVVLFVAVAIVASTVVACWFDTSNRRHTLPPVRYTGTFRKKSKSAGGSSQEESSQPELKEDETQMEMETTQAMSPYLHSALTTPSQKRRKTLAEKRLEMARIADETISRSRSRSVSYSREQHSDFTQDSDSVDVDHPTDRNLKTTNTALTASTMTPYVTAPTSARPTSPLQAMKTSTTEVEVFPKGPSSKPSSPAATPGTTSSHTNHNVAQPETVASEKSTLSVSQKLSGNVNGSQK